MSKVRHRNSGGVYLSWEAASSDGCCCCLCAASGLAGLPCAWGGMAPWIPLSASSENAAVRYSNLEQLGGTWWVCLLSYFHTDLCWDNGKIGLFTALPSQECANTAVVLVYVNCLQLGKNIVEEPGIQTSWALHRLLLSLFVNLPI